MTRYIRIKRHLKILETEGGVRFIQTLDKGVELPLGKVTDALLHVLQLHKEESKIMDALSASLGISTHQSKALVDKLVEQNVLETFDPQQTELSRYDRQWLFFDGLLPTPSFQDNILRQEKIKAAHVLIVGIGGIGNYIAASLCAAGVGKMSLVDNDLVELTNLNRQILFSENDVAKQKTEAAANRLHDMNSECIVSTHHMQIGSAVALEKLLTKLNNVTHVVVSADKPNDLVLWFSALRKKYNYAMIKCGYMGHQGLVGPLLTPQSKDYEELFESWAPLIHAQREIIQHHNQKHVAASTAAGNGILANMAAMELLKHISGVGQLCLFERRLLFDLNTFESRYD